MMLHMLYCESHVVPPGVGLVADPHHRGHVEVLGGFWCASLDLCDTDGFGLWFFFPSQHPFPPGYDHLALALCQDGAGGFLPKVHYCASTAMHDDVIHLAHAQRGSDSMGAIFVLPFWQEYCK